MAWVHELRAAIGGLTPLPIGAPAPTAEERSGSLAYYPAVGLLIGAGTAVVGSVVGRVAGQPWAGVAAVAVLDLASRCRGRGGLAMVTGLLRPGEPAARANAVREAPGVAGWIVTATALGVKLWAATRMPAAGLVAACMLAPLLGRWAIVVEAHGGRADLARGAAVGIVGRASFREFGVASVFTFLVLMGFGQAVGLLLLVTTALATLGWRLVVHRRLGGFTGRMLAATAEGVETLVFVVLGSLPALGA